MTKLNGKSFLLCVEVVVGRCSGIGWSWSCCSTLVVVISTSSNI